MIMKSTTGMIISSVFMISTVILFSIQKESESFDGHYEAQPWSEIKLPDGKRFYIGKRLKAFNGKEYFLVANLIVV